jgi:hypothetical protein
VGACGSGKSNVCGEERNAEDFSQRYIDRVIESEILVEL